MITYVVKRRYRSTVEPFFATFGSGLADRFQIVHYEDLDELTEVAPGVCVFADLDRLSASEVEAAGELRRQLLQSGGVRPLNDPKGLLRRVDLLTLLHRQGVNHFRAYRVTETRHPSRFPVFLRYEDEHWGAISPVLHSQAELDRALACACVLHRRPRHLLIVEFCDVRSEDGLYRKYSAFLVGGRVVPRDLIFDRGWLQKDIALVNEATIAEERRYLETNPHQQELLEVARSAGIDYGRVDYGFRSGELQVWEINTNPIIARAPDAYRPDHVGNQSFFATAMCEALEALAATAVAAIPVAVRVPSQPRGGAAREWPRTLQRGVWDVASRVGRSAPARPLVGLLEQLVAFLYRPLRPYVALRLRPEMELAARH